MRPSDFILNSDYLSIAQVDSKTYDVTVGAGSLVFQGVTEQNFDFNTTAQAGAVDRILISKDSGSYRLGSYMTLIPVWESDFNNNVVGFLNVYRTSRTNIRAKLVLENYGTGTSTYPGMTFKIKVSSFKAPNVF